MHTPDILGVVIDVTSTQQKGSNKLREITIVTEEKLATKLTLWNDLGCGRWPTCNASIRRLVILAKSIRVTSFQGISLSASTMSNIIIDPPYAAARDLDNRKRENSVEIDNLLKHLVLFNDKSVLATSPCSLQSIKELKDAKQGEHSLIAGFQICISPHIKLSYSACSNCHSATITPIPRPFHCFRCASVQTSTPREV
ncbi:replication protein A 70 kDa DNA-binding subunit B-like [Andrographis paniculata]|uniref:replication protein A 70 kDa DNA-binding subunit B-like n=1 Tax=Andrographis paniculata TaxID=175694 RepID=UPI0021E8EBC2|nr:replication protein A 70 kDa DNA-binding subunit B-like [Andrographis paniculata]